MSAGFIDIYCERTTAAIWDEPLNAVSNVAFLIAAFAAFWAVQRRGRPDWIELALITLAAMIGVGSFLFHIFPFPWAELSDVIPIWTFVAGFVLATIYRNTGQDIPRTLRIAGIAAVITGAVFWLTSDDVTSNVDNHVGPLNGSLQYAPALAALVIFALLTQVRRHPARHMVTGAACAFLAALSFRSADIALCPAWPTGTHFLWHSLNGVVVGLMLFALIRHMPPKRRGV